MHSSKLSSGNACLRDSFSVAKFNNAGGVFAADSYKALSAFGLVSAVNKDVSIACFARNWRSKERAANVQMSLTAEKKISDVNFKNI